MAWLGFFACGRQGPARFGWGWGARMPLGCWGGAACAYNLTGIVSYRLPSLARPHTSPPIAPAPRLQHVLRSEVHQGRRDRAEPPEGRARQAHAGRPALRPSLSSLGAFSAANTDNCLIICLAHRAHAHMTDWAACPRIGLENETTTTTTRHGIPQFYSYFKQGAPRPQPTNPHPARACSPRSAAHIHCIHWALRFRAGQ